MAFPASQFTAKPSSEWARFSSPYSTVSRKERPMSEATEFIETDVEDDDSSLFEEDSENSGSSHRDSLDSRRQSQTTVSSYEVPTPRSSRARPFEVMIKPVEGPKGPHLFRASQASADFFLDGPLQLSPIMSRDDIDVPCRTETAFSRETVVPRRYTESPPPLSHSPRSDDPSQWSIEQVSQYMTRSDIPREVITKLQVHDISGDVLMHLQFEDLKELDITSFGKRHQLWNAIQSLKGGERGPSPVPMPLQDVTRPCSNIRSKSDGDVPCSPCSGSPISTTVTPISCGTNSKKRRHNKKPRRYREEIEPGESVSIVAIEEVIPKPHECSKGEECPTWRRRERLLRAIRKEQAQGGSGWPVSPARGGHIMITGDPGNASTAETMLNNTPQGSNDFRPTSEAVPSVVASSDLLGPGQLPEFALHEDILQQLERRDPQENVKQFLNFQHVPTARVEEPPSPPPLEMFPATHYQAFHNRPADISSYFHYPEAITRCGSVPVQQRPHDGLKNLSKLTIPRSASANPHLEQSTLSPCRTVMSPRNNLRSPANATSGFSSLHRPGSEVDVPVTAIPTGPISRDNSQSAPPEMNHREPVAPRRSASRSTRRPSFAMPKLQEDQVFTVDTIPATFTARTKQQRAAEEKTLTRAQFGSDVAYAGWMKKRKTKLLRHEWQDAHCRLHGTILDLHENNRLSAALMDTIDVDEYSVAVSTPASNSKLSSALKSLKISSNHSPNDKKRDGANSSSSGGGVGGAAFAFQLVPGDKERAKFASGKTHHFSVKDANERIDWMRELMLAKAKKQKDCGFVVEHNGVQA